MIMVLLFCTALLFCLWLSAALIFQHLFGWTGGCITGVVVVLFAFSMIYDPAKRVSDRQTKQYDEKHAQWKQSMDLVAWTPRGEAGLRHRAVDDAIVDLCLNQKPSAPATPVQDQGIPQQKPQQPPPKADTPTPISTTCKTARRSR